MRQKLPAWLLVVALVVGSVFLLAGGPGVFIPRSLAELWNLGHVPFFALLAHLLLRWPHWHRFSRRTIWLSVLLLVLALGILVEYIQYGIGRDPDWHDVGRNLCGALLALVITPGCSMPAPPWRHWLRGLMALLILLVLTPFVTSSVDEIHARTNFPELANFSSPLELTRWGGHSERSRVSGFDQREGSQMKVVLLPARYSGAGLEYFPGDWRGYETLNFELFLQGEEMLRVVFRVHDHVHRTVQPTYMHRDRLTYITFLEPGWNLIRIGLHEVRNAPRDRAMDMAQIVDAGFFAASLQSPRALYVDRVWLD
jgi:hypothetical protein